MSTTVVLEVTLPNGVEDPNRVVAAPTDVLAALASLGQPTGHGLLRRGQGPWRLRFQLSGPDRVEAGKALESKLRDLGYDADLVVWR